ncbi:thiolase, C-terminal domain protein [Mycobacterium xenopi 4042]|uniref:Thiolase, C-terminal domain protein n=1 Tax=Mycobacterium xenopi 4042 TaxID=1299334 RepID=X8E010_MYCXE|nr:thiolase, C-terminal domain protein [Mycobacterium xenopi 4042]
MMQAGEQALDIARTALLTAGWPETVPGVTVDRQCGSSQQSIHFAAAGVVAGHYDVVVAGGVESMSRVPMGSSLANGGRPFPDAFLSRYNGAIPNQGIGAEMIAEQWGFDRTMLDEFSLGSHEKAAAAQDSGAFDDQIVAIKDPDGNVVLKDEGIRRGTTIEKMAELKPAFKEDGVIHAGNSSQISDGPRRCCSCRRRRRRRWGSSRSPKYTLRRWPAPTGDHAHRADPGHPEGPEEIRPEPGRHRDLRGQRGVRARAAGLAARHRRRREETQPQRRRYRAGPSARWLGARIMTTLLYHMRDKGIRYGLQTMCEGGGQANATIVELL